MQGYKLSKEAQHDLTAIKDYTRINWGDKQAQHYVSEIVIVNSSTPTQAFEIKAD